MKASLQTWQEFKWKSFWAELESLWEFVFTTWVTWYELTLTDPSYAWQIIVFTQPLIWNYWVPNEDRDEYWLLKNFESEKIWAKWVIVSEYSEEHSHWKAVCSLWDWLKKQGIPWISWVDTRALTKILRSQWSTLGWLINEKSSLPKEIEDPNTRNLAWECSCTKVQVIKPKNPIWKSIVAYDFWIKNNILRSLADRWITIYRVPHDYKLEMENSPPGKIKVEDWFADWLFLSNWPWDPDLLLPHVKDSICLALENNINTFWICLWNQILSLSAWAKTEKMPYWHRWINQPCMNLDTWKCYITSQNHGFHVKADSLPESWQLWWTNANDKTVEWVRHKTKPFRSVQFHPEAFPWPEDTSFLFDEFIESL